MPYIALLLSHIIWGINFIVAKVTLQEFPEHTLAFLRFAIASLLLAPFFYAQTKKVKIKQQDYPRLIAVGILMVTLNISLFFTGIQKTSAIDAATLTLIIPMLSVLLGWWFLKEHVFLVNLAGIALGLIGAIIVIGLPSLLTGNLSPTTLIGNLFIVLASISWVVGATISRKLLKTYSSMEVTAIIFMVGTITFFIPALFDYIRDPAWPTRITTIGVIGLTYMTLLSSVSAYFLFEWGLAKTSVVVADLFQYIEPFIATVVAVLVLGEKITNSFLIGSVLIVIGVYMGTIGKQIHHRIRHHRH